MRRLLTGASIELDGQILTHAAMPFHRRLQGGDFIIKSNILDQKNPKIWIYTP
jgi:hypothetical protein